jgi:hypothetical protein
VKGAARIDGDTARERRVLAVMEYGNHVSAEPAVGPLSGHPSSQADLEPWFPIVAHSYKAQIDPPPR